MWQIGAIDFEGQRLADSLTTWLLTLAGIIAFVVGFAMQDLRSMWTTFLLGLIITLLVVVPPWPFFNKHPLKWQKPEESKKEK